MSVYENDGFRQSLLEREDEVFDFVPQLEGVATDVLAFNVLVVDDDLPIDVKRLLRKGGEGVGEGNGRIWLAVHFSF